MIKLKTKKKQTKKERTNYLSSKSEIICIKLIK